MSDASRYLCGGLFGLKSSLLKKVGEFLSLKKIKITLIKSGIDRPERQKLTLRALGLNKLHRTKEHEATPQVLGMIRKVEHLVKVEEA